MDIGTLIAIVAACGGIFGVAKVLDAAEWGQ